MPRKEISIVESGKTYLGVVEDNKDPERQCRCKIRVVNVHDGQNKDGKYEIETKNLPWAKPWKDLNGNASNVPDLGKVVVVVFEKAKTNSPEYIYSNHYNVNLEKKMAAITEADYLSMKSLLFDHKTQIYVNDTEGLKMDHKFNNINITEKAIDVNLKDNFGKLSLGTPNATQRAILGDNFMQWFDAFLDLFVQQGALIGNFGAPVISSPQLLSHIMLYQQLKEPKLLSKNVYIVDNDYVKKQTRVADATVGDNWESTVTNNELTKQEPVTYNSVAGASSTTFDKPADTQPKADGTTQTSDTKPQTTETPPKKDVNPDARTIIQLMKDKSYTLYNEQLKLNIVAVRNQCLKSGDRYTDSFSDDLYVMWLNESAEWEVSKFKFSTVPGLEFTLTRSMMQNGMDALGRRTKIPNTFDKFINKKVYSKMIMSAIDSDENSKVLTPSQYLDTFQLTNKELTTKSGASFLFYEDDNVNSPSFTPRNLAKPKTMPYNVVIGRGFPGGKNVGFWGMFARQCFSTEPELSEFLSLCQKHVEKHGNSITYTLVTKNDWTKATQNATVNKNDPGTDPETAANPPEEKAAAEVKDKPAGKPAELKNSTDVKAFQILANKSGEKVKEDGSWGPESNAAWEKLKEAYLKKIGFVSNSTIRLCASRLYPYGKVVKQPDGTYIYQSPFNNNKYTITLYSNERFMFYDNLLQKSIGMGSFSDACLEMSATVNGSKFVQKGPNAWDNIRKMLTKVKNA
jgi:hypothetical protein